MVKEILMEAELRMRGSVAALESDLQTFRTGVASPQLLDRIARIVAEHHRSDWVDIHQLRAWRAGSLIHMDLHLVLPQNLSLEKAHQEAKILEQLLIDAFGGNAGVLVHMDPCDPVKCPICGRPDCDLRHEERRFDPFWDRQRMTRASSRIEPEGKKIS